MAAHSMDRNSDGQQRALQGALIAAVRRGHHDCIRQLVSCGADVNLVDPLTSDSVPSEGWTEITTIALLAALGANVNAADLHGETALMRAAVTCIVMANRYEDSADVLKVLVELGANVHAVDTLGRTALRKVADCALSGRYRAAAIEVLKVLVDLGADVNTVDHFGQTVLMSVAEMALLCASVEDAVEVMGGLVALGANVNAVDRWGQTAGRRVADIAPYCRSYDAAVVVMTTLATLGANVSAVDNDRAMICVSKVRSHVRDRRRRWHEGGCESTTRWPRGRSECPWQFLVDRDDERCRLSSASLLWFRRFELQAATYRGCILSKRRQRTGACQPEAASRSALDANVVSNGSSIYSGWRGVSV